MHPYTDETLVAYADGELAEVEARAVAAAAAADPALARRIHEFTESRRLLREAFDTKLTEPVPQRLLDLLNGGAKVVPLPVRAAVRAQRWRNWAPTALAASLALAIGLSVPRRDLSPATATVAPLPATLAMAGLPADARLIDRALETLASGVPLEVEASGRRSEILPVATLRTAQGALCREFESSVSDAAGTRGARGLACRQGDGHWVPQALVARSAPVGSDASDRYVPAGGSALELPSVLGESHALTPAEEEKMIERGWQ